MNLAPGLHNCSIYLLHQHFSCQMHIILQGSISPTFYMQLLHTWVAPAAFLCLCFRFVLYWRKTVGVKAAHRTLVKLTPEVNFTNILHAALEYKSFDQSFLCLHFTVGLNYFWAQEYWRKCAHKMLVKLTTDLLIRSTINFYGMHFNVNSVHFLILHLVFF